MADEKPVPVELDSGQVKWRDVPKAVELDSSQVKPKYLGQGLAPSGVDVSKQAPEGDLPDPTPFIRRAMPGLLPMGGAMLGSALGPGGTILGAGAGSLASQGLRGMFPGMFGETAPTDVRGQIDETGRDILGQAIVPGILGKVMDQGVKKTVAETIANTWLKKFPRVREVASEEMGKQIGQRAIPETALMEEAANKAGPLIKVGGSKMESNDLAQMLGGIPRGGDIAKTAQKAFSDVSGVRNLKLLTGDPALVEQLATTRAIRAGSQAGNVNPTKILKELDNEVYSEAFRPAQKEAFSNVLKEMESQLPGPVESYVAKYSKGHLLMKIPAAIAGAHFGGALGTTAATLYLTDAALGKIASDVVGSKMLVQAMRTGWTAPSSTLLQKGILGILRGSEVMLMTPDGKEKKVTIPTEETSR